jgi:hypothetical protein
MASGEPNRRNEFPSADPGGTPEAIREAAARNELPVDEITRVSMLDPYFYVSEENDMYKHSLVRRFASTSTASRPARTKKTLAGTIAASMIAAAIVAPGASARYAQDPPGGASASGGSAAVFPAGTTVVFRSTAARASQTRSSDFAWGDAGIGAAGTLVLLGLGSSGVAVRRTRGRRRVATS